MLLVAAHRPKAHELSGGRSFPFLPSPAIHGLLRIPYLKAASACGDQKRRCRTRPYEGRAPSLGTLGRNPFPVGPSHSSCGLQRSCSLHQVRPDQPANVTWCSCRSRLVLGDKGVRLNPQRKIHCQQRSRRSKTCGGWRQLG